jgi:hypothetical protein
LKQHISSTIQQSVDVEVTISLAQGVVCWRKLTTMGETLCKRVILKLFAQATTGISAGNDPEWSSKNTENDI